MLAVTELLQSEGLEALLPLAITAKEYPTFLLLNYSQHDSPKTHPVVKECRGLVLDKDTYAPLAQGFERFFNYGEVEDDLPSFDGAVVWEKIDGTCILVWYNPHTEEWQCSTRKMGYAEGKVGDTELTFCDIFERAIGGKVNDIFAGDAGCFSFCFELVSPESRITKRYTETKAYLINMRDNGEEFPVGNTSFTPPRQYPISSVSECVEAASALPRQDEGYVVRWPNGYRLKIKNPAHVALVRLRNNGAVTDKRVLEIIDSGEADEYLLHFPEDTHRFRMLISAKYYFLADLQYEWGELIPHLYDEERDLAERIKQTKHPHMHFARWRKGLTYEEIYGIMTLEHKLRSIR